MQSCNYASASLVVFIGALLACTSKKGNLRDYTGIPEGEEGKEMVVQQDLGEGRLLVTHPYARRPFLIHERLIVKAKNSQQAFK